MSGSSGRKTTIGQRELEMVAEAMIEMFGEGAADKAMARAAEYQQKGEDDGREFWILVAQAIHDELDHRSGKVGTE